MTIGFGSEPAGATPSRAAAIWYLSRASDGFASLAARATDCGSVQFTTSARRTAGAHQTAVTRIMMKRQNELLKMPSSNNAIVETHVCLRKNCVCWRSDQKNGERGEAFARRKRQRWKK